MPISINTSAVQAEQSRALDAEQQISADVAAAASLRGSNGLGWIDATSSLSVARPSGHARYLWIVQDPTATPTNWAAGDLLIRLP